MISLMFGHYGHSCGASQNDRFCKWPGFVEKNRFLLTAACCMLKNWITTVPQKMRQTLVSSTSGSEYVLTPAVEGVKAPRLLEQAHRRAGAALRPELGGHPRCVGLHIVVQIMNS